jgi:hypothetical protein
MVSGTEEAGSFLVWLPGLKGNGLGRTLFQIHSVESDLLTLFIAHAISCMALAGTKARFDRHEQ